MKERKLLFTAHSKLTIRCLPFLLSILLLFVPSLEVSAYNNLFDESVTHQSLFYPWVYGEPDNTIVETVDLSLNYNPGIQFYSNKYYALNLYLESNINKYGTDISEVDFLYRYYIIYAGQKYYFNSNESVLSLVIPGNDYSQIAIGCEVTYIVSPIWDDLTSKWYANSASTQVTLFTRTRIWELLPEEISSNEGFIIVDESIQEGNQLLQDQMQQQHTDSVNQTNTLTNGYESSVVGSAENDFNAGAGELTGIEDTLSDSSTQFVDTFTRTGFDDSLLDNIAPSMQYVVTWFTNFWNMGGALTKCFTLCFALYIAFYIVRVRS